MTDPAGRGSVECASCGAVWIIGSTLTGIDGPGDGTVFEGSGKCLRCGGALRPVDEAGPDSD